jgi:hypothetical protein
MRLSNVQTQVVGLAGTYQSTSPASTDLVAAVRAASSSKSLDALEPHDMSGLVVSGATLSSIPMPSVKGSQTGRAR